jgi:phosphohistidine phosphatase
VSVRRLLVLRHGKSAWDTGAPSDHERPLAKRGRKSSRAVGQALAAHALEPDVVLSSDAQRATETWAHVQEGLGSAAGGADVRIVPELYLGGLHELLLACEAVPEAARTTLVIGHNPGLEQAVSQLTRVTVTLKTADLAWIGVGTRPWSRLGEAVGALELEATWRARALLE